MELKEKRTFRSVTTGELFVIAVYECGACCLNGKWYTEFASAKRRAKQLAKGDIIEVRE